MKKTIKILEWGQGLNTNADPSMVAPGELVQADHIIMGTRRSKKKRDGMDHGWDSLSTGSLSVLKLHDFWYGTSSKTQTLMGIYSDKSFKRVAVADGTVTALTDTGTAWSGTITRVSAVSYNNLCIMASDISGNIIKQYSGSGDVIDLAVTSGTAPNASILREFQGRLFTNDMSNLDRIHFSPVHDHTIWGGYGDSGAMDIGVGDGDPDGITGIFPSFKGDLFIAKRTKLYRMRTGGSNDPVDWIVELVSASIGCISHNSIVQVEDTDMVWASERGIHSLAAVQQYGDFEATFVSAKIQKTYNEDISRSRLKFIQGAYDPTINSIAFTMTESSVSSGDSSNSATLYGTALSGASNNAVYLFNIGTKEWYKWPGISCQSIASVRDSSDNKVRFFFGTNISRVSKTKSGNPYDLTHADVQNAVKPKIKTGFIYPEGDPYIMSSLKRLILYYRPDGTHNITTNVYVDNQSLDNENNSKSYAQTNSSGLLGSTFILGSSVLGFQSQLGPYHQTVSGTGRGFQLEILNTGVSESFEIQGFGLEYIPLENPGEVRV